VHSSILPKNKTGLRKNDKGYPKCPRRLSQFLTNL
jgi:hypothetical protein